MIDFNLENFLKNYNPKCDFDDSDNPSDVIQMRGANVGMTMIMKK